VKPFGFLLKKYIGIGADVTISEQIMVHHESTKPVFRFFKPLVSHPEYSEELTLLLANQMQSA